MSPADFVGVNRHRAEGRKPIGAHLGTALRECRRAVEQNFNGAPPARVAASARRAVEALNCADWVIAYQAGERDQ